MHAYPKIWNLGHKNVAGMFEGTVIVQEKYDGSQFSFERTPEGDLVFKSHHAIVDPDSPGKLFGHTVRHLQSLEDHMIVSGWTYRGEAFCSAKQNTLKYRCVPNGHLVLFDVETSHHTFMDSTELEHEAQLLEVEPVEQMGKMIGINLSPEMLDRLLDTESSLGGTKVEGVVFKNYKHQTYFGDPAMAKFVSEAFKESHKKNLDWKQGKDLYHALGSQFAVEARWRKGVQRLRDDGQLESSPRDIGILLRELSLDLLDEYGDELRERVWKNAWKRISKAANTGFPEWYKRELAFSSSSASEAQADGDDGRGVEQPDGMGREKDENNRL